MIALFVNDNPELIGTTQEINDRIEEIKKSRPDADFSKQDTCKCGACGSEYFDPLEAACCPCHDDY